MVSAAKSHAESNSHPPVSEVLEVRYRKVGRWVMLELHLHSGVVMCYRVKPRDAVIDLQGAARIGQELIEAKLAAPPSGTGGRP